MEVNIIKFDHFGRGIGYIKNKVIFINKALPEEIVDIKIIKEKSKYIEGEIINIKKKSKDRIESICPFYNDCGGCNFLHTNYELEKEFKINKAIDLLGKCDNFYETNNLNYRNKVTLHVKDNKIGFYKENSNELINIDYCYLLDEKINKVINDLDKINKDGINKIIIKSHSNQVLLDIDGEVNNKLLNTFNYVDTIINNGKVIKGLGYINEVIDGNTFKITSNAFFQVNREGLLNIYKVVKEFLKDKNIINALDLYSGTSLWGILISKYCKNIKCIEVNKEACLNALDNIKNNNIKNIEVINGKVSDYINTFKDIDLIIIDPPRSGLDNKTIDYLKQIKSKYIIYISCDMYTLKRDLNILKGIYNIENISLVDMFKRTYHCESIVILERR